MQIVKSPLYERQKEKLVAKKKLKLELINEAEALFAVDPINSALRPHNITCKKDKRRRSITVPKTDKKYRILYTDGGDTAYFQQILHHDDYDRVNQDC